MDFTSCGSPICIFQNKVVVIFGVLSLGGSHAKTPNASAYSIAADFNP